MSVSLQERFHTWAQANRLGFECKIFFGVDDLKVHLVVSKAGWAQRDYARCRHEFEWVKQGQWQCKRCNSLLAAIFWEKRGEILLQGVGMYEELKKSS